MLRCAQEMRDWLPEALPSTARYRKYLNPPSGELGRLFVPNALSTLLVMLGAVRLAEASLHKDFEEFNLNEGL
jgi:hypothetical protein